MVEAARSPVPSWFRIVAGLFVLWNLFGVVMYLHSVGMFGDPAANLNEAERAAAAAIPAAIMGAFAVGTWGGLIGSLGLLMRKKWAYPLLILSLIALLVLEGWIVFLSGNLEAYGMAVPIMVTLGAIILAWLAHHARQSGWLS